MNKILTASLIASSLFVITAQAHENASKRCTESKEYAKRYKKDILNSTKRFVECINSKEQGKDCFYEFNRIQAPLNELGKTIPSIKAHCPR
ncbi:MAG: hypothetical protein GQ570_08300 [Helicobacteraceae bacterium]|nr:hypothetical protein [Helicobacteraceae bacterium]